MSASFSRNLEAAQGLEASIRSGIQRLSSTSSSDYESIASQIDSQINELQTKISGLRGLMKALSSDEREIYAEEIQDLERNCSQFRNQLQSARQQAGTQNRVQNMHDANMQKGDKIINSLQETSAINNDTIQTQKNTLNTLDSDRQLLNNISGNLSIVDTEASTGERTATRIYRRQMMIRIISWTICAILFALLIFSLAWKLSHRKKKDSK